MSTENAGHSPWDDVRAVAKVVGKRASIAGQKAKLKAEIALMDHKIKGRKQLFGVELYDFLVPFAEKDPTFIIESDTLTNIQGLFVTAFKDNKALLQKKATKDHDLTRVAEKRAISFPIPAQTIGGKVMNAGKSAKMTGQETAIKAKKAMIEREMNGNKQLFGLHAYELLVQLEDNTKWLPSDRDVRFFYDQARREVTALENEKKAKEADFGVLGLE